MTVEELFSVQEDNHRLRSLYIELANHENFNPYKANEISDMPKGGGGKNFLEWYAEEKERIENDIEFYKNPGFWDKFFKAIKNFFKKIKNLFQKK